ncbi:SigE family RNA polymerase sigma factor [Nocardioides jishulii]|uniref:SigE family RNA polymerase sigma factor n=1 Tax=Nocardioides jishulii TaxID=2575440 RepID=A0A4V5TJN9_9ACTN|nr:SigE family RNA polymerase sigma factor [Nocardioides jishulii]QCX26727.1 SigE family RNA polymerase sigma factor [Nocardioides jishulii]TKI60303.1 SigE family RNA polymerase sigma factor [Nocardioides jishulii]
MSRDDEFGAYVAARRPHLYRSAWLLCGDQHRAEDLVQDALTKLYLAWPRVHRMANVEAYVRRMLVNGHIDESRRPWRREHTTYELPDAPAAQPPGEEADELWTALRALPPGQRRVVVLRHYWGLSVEETAGDLNVSVGTVKSQTSAALTALRRALLTEPASAVTSMTATTQGDAR